MVKHKNKIVTGGLAVLGIVMIVLGLQSGILPPTLTGIGFLLMAWHTA